MGPGDRCLDVGSNVGWFAGIMRASGASVVTVEPNADLEADLRCAVGGKDAPALLHLSRRPNWHSLLIPASYTGTAVTVPVRTLDSIVAEVGPPSFLKLDVEGAEWEILTASRFLEDETPRMMVELHPNIIGRARAGALLGVLRGLGYGCLAVDRMWDFEVFRRLGINPVHADGWGLAAEMVDRRQPVVLHLRGPSS